MSLESVVDGSVILEGFLNRFGLRLFIFDTLLYVCWGEYKVAISLGF